MGKRRNKGKQKWLVFGAAALALLCIALVVAATFMLRPRERITWENYFKLKPGMSRAEVVAILGPPRPYPAGPKGVPILAVPWAYESRKGPISEPTLIQPTHVWESEYLTISAVFDPDDTLDSYTCDPGDELEGWNRVPEHVKRAMLRDIQPK